MYIKFCRGYGEGKKDELASDVSPDSELCVQLEGEKGKQDEEKPKGCSPVQAYRILCCVFAVLSLILLMVIISLSIKLQAEPACPDTDSTTLPSACTLTTCQALLNITPKQEGCNFCPEDWLHFGGFCYFLSTHRLSWTESQRNCSSMGASLAVISNFKVQELLTDSGDLMYWIGLAQNKSRWIWVDNTPLRTSYWADEPMNGDCAYLKTEGEKTKNWMKQNCKLYTYFICQMKIN